MIKNLFGNRPSVEPIALAAFISPGSYEVTTSNGAFTSPTFTGSAIGGTPPYTYAWTITRGSVVSPDSNATKFSLSGNRQEISADATLTVTDDAAATVTAVVNLIIQFGNEIQ